VKRRRRYQGRGWGGENKIKKQVVPPEKKCEKKTTPIGVTRKRGSRRTSLQKGKQTDRQRGKGFEPISQRRKRKGAPIKPTIINSNQTVTQKEVRVNGGKSN